MSTPREPFRDTPASWSTRSVVTASLGAASKERRKANRARGEARDHERVRARAIELGARVMITRRCHDRRFFLTPCGDPRKGHTSEETAIFFGYTVARAVKIYGASFHGAIQRGITTRT